MTEKTSTNTHTSYEIGDDVQNTYTQLLEDSKVQAGLIFLEQDNERTVEDQIEITEIPAPTFDEAERGKDYKKRLEKLGITHIQTDRVGNVFGIRPGVGNGPKLFVSAHLDTVFPIETDVKAIRKDGKVYAPGISDDGRGLASVLTLIRALNHADIQTTGDIIFGATVGEEGLGDLRGVKAFFEEQLDIDGFISIEPGDPSRNTYLGTGSHRYEVTFTGPGGHSFGDFGKPSAIHALGRAISKISDVNTPNKPRTTFTVGTIEGGTSVNTIAAEATMLVDMRSTSQEELLKLEGQVLSFIEQAKDEENKRWEGIEGITVELKLVGDRPAGSQPADAPIVQAAMASSQALGFEAILGEPSSTDSNVPISLGIPAVTLGGGGKFGGAHTLGEYFDPTDAHYGVQKILLTILGLVGVEGVSNPILAK
ncbi:M20/M25/M40 family metallo-hydrolase [Bacillus horti]|uniref:Acetylornithine deacetylase/succinyl-diaminopimelate desuccinylase-like protein n=1 Tax=Caldalkalibacillus horti TaxID=77523 RepID=A0ABT9VYK8_9BACI|nr:M20/M25/M40 family metallo-hydrolase [Bacillus horti]MDQ0165950.1 acetylornithine deacetylase/succinyl-diaminopimelate desuccinylase-like protein [Bacillus horti]